MRDFSIIKQRILQYLENKGISKYECYQKTGITNGVFSQKSGISEDNLLSFLSYYKDINHTWFLTGRGDMLRTDGESTAVQAEPTIIYRDNPKDVEIMQLLREQNAQLKEQIAELKKPKFCGVPINMSNTPPVEPSPLAVAESKPTSSKKPNKTSIKSEIHT